MMHHFRTRFQRLRATIFCPPEEGKTSPEFMDDCDINKIMAKYRKTGVLPVSAHAAAMRYGDFSSIPDFHTMRNKVKDAEHLFAALPADVRESFENDPGRFMLASTTPEGQKLLLKHGLASLREPEPAPTGQVGKAGTEPAVPPKGGKKLTTSDE